jgi:agmatinase
LVRPFYPQLADINIIEAMNVVDLGDVSLVSSDVVPSMAAIETAMDHVLNPGGFPVTFGGDGLVSLPQMRSLHRYYNDLVVIHIDAHTDAYDVEGYNTSSTFTRAAEEQIVETAKSFHIGARGSLAVHGAYAHTRSLGYNLITGEDVRSRGVPKVLDQIRRTVENRPVFLCFDMDYIDPSAAPGVATPTWGGPDPAAAFELLNGLAGLRIVASDINTVSPAHDVGGMTASLAAHVALITLNLIYLGRNS